MKLTKGLLLIAFSLFSLVIIITSCEEDEMEITGDSGLLVVNELTIDAEIYFDGDFIGDVDDEDSREWSVPSGTHTVKAECSYMGDVEKTPYFPKGGVIKFTVFRENSSNEIFIKTTSNYLF
jgi:hypothetical protein